MATIDQTANNFIGKGLTFPIELNSSGRPDIKGGVDLLKSAITDILSWTVGTRFMLGEYGTRLEQLLQEPNDLVTQSLVKHFTVEVISKWEKRLEVLEVKTINQTDYLLHIYIKYKVKNTKEEGSFIFPYYSQLIH